MGEDMGYSEQKIVSMYRTAFLKTSILLSVIFAGCFAKEKAKHLPYYNTPDFTPQFLNAGNEINEKVTHTINPFSFTDQNGKRITEKNVEGKIHIANFIFTSCVSICPVMTKHMKLLQQEFKDNPDIVMLSYSVTPWIDNVGRLKKYADNNQITSPNWHLLTGSKAEIYTLARQSYFAEEDLGFTKDSTQFLHTEHILLVDKTKRIRGIYNGTLELEAEQLIKDIKELMKE
jgi:protein SCO1/2